MDHEDLARLIAEQAKELRRDGRRLDHQHRVIWDRDRDGNEIYTPRRPTQEPEPGTFGYGTSDEDLKFVLAPIAGHVAPSYWQECPLENHGRRYVKFRTTPRGQEVYCTKCQAEWSRAWNRDHADRRSEINARHYTKKRWLIKASRRAKYQQDKESINAKRRERYRRGKEKHRAG